MEAIKFSVEVKVDFSESTKEFINNFVSAIVNAAPTTAPTASKPIPAIPTASPAAPAAKPERTATPEAAPAPAVDNSPAPAVNVTIDQVRQALAAKVNSHREDIKAKLSEFGAPSVTRLDPSHYMDMLIFLNSLS